MSYLLKRKLPTCMWPRWLSHMISQPKLPKDEEEKNRICSLPWHLNPLRYSFISTCSIIPTGRCIPGRLAERVRSGLGHPVRGIRGGGRGLLGVRSGPVLWRREDYAGTHARLVLEGMLVLYQVRAGYIRYSEWVILKKCLRCLIIDWLQLFSQL